MPEYCLIDRDNPPEWAIDPSWYDGREVAPHLEQQGHEDRLRLGAQLLRENVQGPVSVTDLGAGDGGFLSLLPKDWAAWGYDLSPAACEAATARGVKVNHLDVLKQREFLDLGEVVVMQEILEHLVDPHEYLRWLASKPYVTTLLASSPYTETPEAHYEYHAWAWDQRSYRAMLQGAGWKVITHSTAWICQVVVAVKA